MMATSKLLPTTLPALLFYAGDFFCACTLNTCSFIVLYATVVDAALLMNVIDEALAKSVNGRDLLP